MVVAVDDASGRGKVVEEETAMSCCRGGEARISVLHAGCCLKVGRPWSAIKFREGKGAPVEKQAE